MMIQWRKLLGVAVLGLLVMTGCSQGVQAVSIQGVDAVPTANYANHNLEFYFYIPAKVLANKTKKYPVLVCIPGQGCEGKEYADETFRNFAEQEGFILIAPSFVFDEDNFASKTSYQYPAAWSGQALLSMVRKVGNTYGLQTGKFYLHGFSAGAQFALRFPLWDPSDCAAAAGHAARWDIEPDGFIPVKFFVTVGKEDTIRIPDAVANYKRLKSYGIAATFAMYEGAHTLPDDEVFDSFKFFKAARAQLGE